MLLDGKTGIVFGVANKRSLAWAIARRAGEEGARIALTYQGERLEENARELAASLKDPLVLPCDVTATKTSPRCSTRSRKNLARSILWCTVLRTRFVKNWRAIT